MVYAIIRTGGKQHRVSVGDRIDVEKLPGEVGETVEIDQVLAVGEGDNLEVGSPVIPDAKVTCEVVLQDRARKVLVGKYRRRKNYYRKNGHRQSFTRVRIDEISGAGIHATDPKVRQPESAPATES
ncbi:MAG: 50S ribosomal protein L21 [Candidatus Omnitrophica bacterium]|nr:50S ribosomal protein L21 [Candidatus Omnitrophota bacterium]